MAKNKKKLTPTCVKLFLIVGLAFLLRIMWLGKNLFFGFEQGRDMLKLAEVLSGDLVLVGPKTDIAGVFHGALSYYIPLVPFILFGGNPFGIILTYVTINSLAIIFLFKATQTMFDSKVALIASFLYAISYSAIVYARWLSNPSLVPAFTILFLFSLTRIKKHWIYLLLAAAFWSTLFHLLVVVAIILIPPTLIYLYYEKIKLPIKNIAMGLSVVVVLLSTYAVFEMRNKFVMVTNLVDYLKEGSDLSGGDLSFIDQFLKEVVDGLFPASPRIAFLIFALLLFFVIRSAGKKRENLLILAFLLSGPTLFLISGISPLRHFYIITPIFMSITVAFIVTNLLKTGRGKLGITVLGIVILGNFLAYNNWLISNRANFIHHAQRTYIDDMKNLIDYVYQDAGSTEFTYDYYSVPYWKEDAWQYLFQWYGKGKYGYAPPIDRTNVDRSEVFYTFIEPNETTPVHLDNWYGEYKKGLELIDTFESGKLKVEKRTERVVKHDEVN